MGTFWKNMGLMLAVVLAVVGVGVGAAAAAPKQPKDAKVSVVVQTSPNLRAARGEVITYRIVAANNGDSPSRNTVITMPFDPALVRLVDVTFSRETAWVSKLLADAVEIQTGLLASGDDAVTVTVRVQVQQGVAVGTQLGQRLSYAWSSSGNSSAGALGRTNLPTLVVGESSASQQFYQLASAAAPRGKLQFTSQAIFAPGEAVTLWYTTPAGETERVDVKASKVVPEVADTDDSDLNDSDTDYVLADADGAISLEFDPNGLAAGSYTFVARGNLTGLTAVGNFAAR